MIDFDFPYPVNDCDYEPEVLGDKMLYICRDSTVYFPKSQLVYLKYYFLAENVEYKEKEDEVCCVYNTSPHYITVDKLLEIEKNSTNLDRWVTPEIVQLGLTPDTYFIPMLQEYIHLIRDGDQPHRKLTAGMMYKLREFYAYLQSTGHLDGEKWYFFKLAGMSSKRQDFDVTNLVTNDIRKKCPHKNKVYGHLTVATPEEIIYLLCCSPRLYHSLELFENTRKLQTNLCLREWDPELENEDMDFRVFIYHGHVTGISQYKWHTVIAALQHTKYCKEIRKRIIGFWDESKHLFPPQFQQNIVMDAHVSYDLEIVKIIEFNTFGVHQRCGSALFNWIHDYDVLYNTDGKTEFRVLCKKKNSFVKYT